jgi:hypothetical protein
MSRNRIALFVGAAVIAAMVFLHSPSSAQQPKEPDFSHVQIVTYASGMTGFFDSQTGKLYIYDSNWSQCLWAYKLARLGEPMQPTMKVERQGK